MKRSLTLEQLRIPNPCPADWSEMVGDDRSRYCKSCAKHVFDLSARTRDEAQAVLAAHPDGLCVRMTVAADGRVLTRPRRWRRAWATVSAAAAFALGVVGCGRGPETADPTPYRTTGIVATRTVAGDVATVGKLAAPRPTTTMPTTKDAGPCGEPRRGQAD